MEVARVAALRGHRVTLYEKEDRLGGYLPAASSPKHKKDILPFLTWHVSNLKKTGTTIVSGKEATPEMVLEMEPDVVIVAAGAALDTPGIPGIEMPHVISAIDVLLEKVKTGEKVIVAGGGLVGCDVALFLADRGRQVTIIEMLPEVVTDMVEGDGSRGQVVGLLAQKEIECLTNLKIEAVIDDGVVAVNPDGETQTVRADSVVLALGLKPRTEIYDALSGKIPALHAIGDCVEARKIGDAVREGFFTAYGI